jgi:hypothetical protein
MTLLSGIVVIGHAGEPGKAMANVDWVTGPYAIGGEEPLTVGVGDSTPVTEAAYALPDTWVTSAPAGEPPPRSTPLAARRDTAAAIAAALISLFRAAAT